MTNYRINKLIDFLVGKKLVAEADFLIGLVKTSSVDRYRPIFCKFGFSSAVSKSQAIDREIVAIKDSVLQDLVYRSFPQQELGKLLFYPNKSYRISEVPGSENILFKEFWSVGKRSNYLNLSRSQEIAPYSVDEERLQKDSEKILRSDLKDLYSSAKEGAAHVLGKPIERVLNSDVDIALKICEEDFDNGTGKFTERGVDWSGTFGGTGSVMLFKDFPGALGLSEIESRVRQLSSYARDKAFELQKEKAIEADKTWVFTGSSRISQLNTFLEENSNINSDQRIINLQNEKEKLISGSEEAYALFLRNENSSSYGEIIKNFWKGFLDFKLKENVMGRFSESNFPKSIVFDGRSFTIDSIEESSDRSELLLNVSGDVDRTYRFSSKLLSSTQYSHQKEEMIVDFLILDSLAKDLMPARDAFFESVRQEKIMQENVQEKEPKAVESPEKSSPKMFDDSFFAQFMGGSDDSKRERKPSRFERDKKNKRR